MNILSLDTSSRDASIAVLDNEGVLLEYNFTAKDNLSAVLIPSLDFILKALGMEMAQIDTIRDRHRPRTFYRNPHRHGHLEGPGFL